MFAVCEGEDWTTTLLSLVILIEEAHEKNCVQEVRQHQVPERIVVADHSHPEEEADSTRATQTVQVLWGKALGITILSQVNELGYQCDCLHKHGEAHEHLESQEILALRTRMENHWEDEATDEQHRPFEVDLIHTLVNSVLVREAQIDYVGVKYYCGNDLEHWDPQLH